MVAKGSLDTGSTPPRHAWSHFGKKWNIFRTYGWPKKSGVLKIRVIICFCLLIVGRLVNVALPLYSKWIVNSLSDPEGFDYSLIYAMIMLRLLHGGGNMNGFINNFRTYLWIPIRQYTFRELDVTLFNHLHSLPMQWHTSRQIGLVLKAANRGTNCVDDILKFVICIIENSSSLFLFSMLPTLADFAIAVVFFASNFNIYFGIVVFATMSTHLALNIFITEWRTKFRRDMNDRENMMGAIGTDSLLNYETVKYYGNEEYEVKRYRSSIESFQEAEWLNLATMAFQNFLLHGILAVGLFSGSMLAVWMITKHSLTVGDYVLFTSYIVQLYSPLNAFGHHYRMVQKSLIDMENMLSLFDEEPETDPAPDAAPFVHKGGSITADKLVFSYNDNQNILNDISFKVDNGQTVALVGLSGSGKTSIIRLLYRLYDFCVGSLKIDGVDIRKVQAKTLRKQIGIVPQETALFNETIRFNIRYGDLDATDLEVEEAAKAAMIHDKIISLPLSYDTIVGDRGTKLSGGEKQRLAIARTILKKPNFIFLDEATSALDIHTERAIQGCLEKLCKDRTSLVVAHRLSTIVGADCILVMDKGKIVERGTHEQLIAMEGVYHHMWQTQHTKHSSTSSFPSDEDEK